jgi:hypothetical protein
LRGYIDIFVTREFEVQTEIFWLSYQVPNENAYTFNKFHQYTSSV